MGNPYALGCAVLLVTNASLAVYVLLRWDDVRQARQTAEMWRDAYANEATRHAKTRDSIDQRMTGRLP